ncbi:MAG: FkbM family methyltransferase, partial [Alphaproteobacteria bacterium]|nr:FkbM family methyltransferase [Alphaproteobacteria bacterium]
NIAERLLDYKLYKDIKHFMDQDCFNYVFKENVIYLSPIYNNMAPNQLHYSDKEIKDFYDIKFNLDLDNTVILHLTNSRKVWDYEDVWGHDLWMKYYDKYMLKIREYKNLFFRHVVYPNGRHKFYILGIRVLSYKPRFAPGVEVKGNFLYTKEKCPNGRRHIYICGIKVFSYSKKKKGAKPVVVQHDLVDNYRSVFEKNGYKVVRENGKIKIWNNIITVEGEADNTLWTAGTIFCVDEYNFNMNEKYVMFDIGFNLGMTSLHKAQDKNCVKIYAFEPFVPTYKLAMRNMELNKDLSKKITAFNYGLGDKEETIDVNYNHDRPGAMSSVKNVFSECDDVEQIQIKDTSEVLEPLFAKHKEKIFLKIDCEGAEKQILPDLEKSGLIKKVDVIVMEWHFEEPTMLVDLLLRNNFIVFRLNSVPHELGMIRAYRRK